MAEYRLSPAAERDLEGIWQFTYQHWGLAQADRYIDALVTVFAELAHAPEAAPACDHLRAGYRRCRVERHVIYFRFAPNGIAIIRILHERMDAPRHL
jgi:toxin ParE1/3/4